MTAKIEVDEKESYENGVVSFSKNELYYFLDLMRSKISDIEEFEIKSEISYWDVEIEEQFVISNQPRLSVGDLNDDLKFLRAQELVNVAPASYAISLSIILRCFAKIISETD